MDKKLPKAAASAAGKAKAAGKAMKGETGILKHLAGEHGKAATLMKRIAGSKNDSDARDEFFPDLRLELLAHAKSEEKEFYPVLREHAELEDLVARSLEQHERVEKLLDELMAADKHTDAWLRRFEELKSAVEEHVDLEEKHIFPTAKDLLSKDRLSEMEDRYEEQEESVKKKLARA